MLGRHRGIWNYTIGQRKGLGISFSQPMYVCRIDSASNAVILSDNARLFSDSLTVGELNWLSIPAPAVPVEVQVKIRYSHTPSPGCPLSSGVRTGAGGLSNASAGHHTGTGRGFLRRRPSFRRRRHSIGFFPKQMEKALDFCSGFLYNEKAV